MALLKNEYVKQEKINGVIYDMSPSPNYRHGIVNNNINTIIKTKLKDSLCLVFMENLDYKYHPEENDDYVIPDIMILCDRKHLKGGSPQGLADANTNAWTATTNTGRGVTGSVVNAVSAIGTVDAVGRVYEWLNDLITRAQHATDATYHDKEAWGWDKKSPLRDAGTKYDVGNIYQYYHASLAALIAGGRWCNAANAGARCVNCNNYPWNVNTNIGVRGACDLVRAL